MIDQMKVHLMKSRRRNTLVSVLYAILITLLMIFIVQVLWRTMIVSIDFHPIPFNSEVWKATPCEISLDSTRLKMVDDLLDIRPLVGQSRDDIIELIGEPDADPDLHNDSMWYRLGEQRNPFGYGTECLVIQLNEQGIAIEAKLVDD